jgi:hypothetical protein
VTTTPFLARLCAWELDATGSGGWVRIGGVRDGEHSPKTTTADTTTDADNGRDNHQVASRGDEFTLKCKRLEDTANGDRDPGQEAVEAWGRGIGADSIKPFRITTPGGIVHSFNASVEVKLFGGSLNDSSDWECKITVAGDIDVAGP